MLNASSRTSTQDFDLDLDYYPHLALELDNIRVYLLQIYHHCWSLIPDCSESDQQQFPIYVDPTI